MTETDYAKQWGEWLSAELERRGWRQADLVRESQGHIKRDRASKWVNGNERPSHRLAIVAANTLGVPHEVALEVSGYSEPTPEIPDYIVAENEAAWVYAQTPEGAAQMETAYDAYTFDEALRSFHLPESRARILSGVSSAELLAEIGRRLESASMDDHASARNVTHAAFGRNVGEDQQTLPKVAKKASRDPGGDEGDF